MIKSMTGFASLTKEGPSAVVTVTAKSVNHRFLDAQIRLPSTLGAVEADLRTLVQKHVGRGRVELAVTVDLSATPEVEVAPNHSLLRALAAAAQQMHDDGVGDGRLTAGDVLRFPQAVLVTERPVDPETWEAAAGTVREAADEALAGLDAMRRREGESLQADLSGLAGELADQVDRIVAEAAAGAEALETRLRARVAELEAQVDIDENAVAQEVVRFAARSDIHEEVARLGGHLEHMAVLEQDAEPCGRKLDFLVQEMNREVNTIGSKAEGRGLTELIVAAKGTIERMKEQVQNVE